MQFFKRPLLIAVTVCTMLLATGCADDRLAKGVLMIGGLGAAGGAIGAALSPNAQKRGALLGLALGGAVGTGLFMALDKK